MNQYRTVVVADHHKSVFVCQTLDRETGEVRVVPQITVPRALGAPPYPI